MYMRSSLAFALLPLFFVPRSFAAVNRASLNVLNTQSNDGSDGLSPLYPQAADLLYVEDPCSQAFGPAVNTAPQSLEAALCAWLRVGFDPHRQDYVSVVGQNPADARDHFVELRWIRDAVTTQFPQWQDMTISDLFALTQAANEFSNIFRITTNLNLYKTHVDPAYVLDPAKPRIKDEYLCQKFNPPAPPLTFVHERVTSFLNNMQANPNGYVVSAAADIEAHLGLANIVC